MTSVLEASRTEVITTYVWLCEDHVADRSADWSLKPVREPPGFMGRCQDCARGQRAPEAVDFVQTSPGARLPTPEECPKPAPMATWPTRDHKVKP